MSDHSFSKEIFPNIQSKPPLKQLEAIEHVSRSFSVEPQETPLPLLIHFKTEELHAPDMLSSQPLQSYHCPL